MATRASNFLWVGSHTGIDLVNTEAADDGGDPVELVPDFIALVEWAHAAELIDADVVRQCRIAAAPQQRNVLAWFRTLRASLRALLERGDDDPSVGRRLDAVVGDVPVRLGYRPSQSANDARVIAERPLERLRLALAVAALDATRLDRSRIRSCANRRCILLYYDTTKNRSRRWCDMAVCGNRAKASAHYHRANEVATMESMGAGAG
jgi:predicted RNA-binding Zn ribbon-like protein